MENSALPQDVRSESQPEDLGSAEHGDGKAKVLADVITRQPSSVLQLLSQDPRRLHDLQAQSQGCLEAGSIAGTTWRVCAKDPGETLTGRHRLDSHVACSLLLRCIAQKSTMACTDVLVAGPSPSTVPPTYIHTHTYIHVL